MKSRLRALLVALVSVPMAFAVAGPAAADSAHDKPARIALVHAFAATQLPNGQPGGPALTVTIDDVVVATEIPLGTIVPLKRLRPGEHLVRVFLPGVSEPIQEQPFLTPDANRYDVVLGQSPSGGAGLPFVHVFANHAGAPSGQTRLTLRNVSDVPMVSVYLFGPFTPPALIGVARGEQGSAVLPATFSELKVFPSNGGDDCLAWIMGEFPAKTSTVVYAAGLTHDGQGEPMCAFDAILRRVS